MPRQASVSPPLVTNSRMPSPSPQGWAFSCLLPTLPYLTLSFMDDEYKKLGELITTASLGSSKCIIEKLGLDK